MLVALFYFCLLFLMMEDATASMKVFCASARLMQSEWSETFIV